MKKIGMLGAMKSCRQYAKMCPREREQLRERRLREMLLWAKEHSAYYAKLYQDVDVENCSLSRLPPVNKRDLMEHWDDWVADGCVSLQEVNRFMEDLDHIGRKLAKQYMVFTTSGSTGNPLVLLCDDTTNNVMGAINAVRSITRKADMKAFILRGGKSIGVFATGGFYLGNSSVRSRLLQMPWKKRQMAVTSALKPLAEIVKELNEFQPAMLGGYPTNLELLIDEQKSGRLHIHPVLVMTGGEYLSPELQQQLSEAFGCYVQTSYSCTEGGTVACECAQQHFHINDDWLIVEAVDQNNQPVADGVQADKLLLTNLFQFTQPMIRYEITDRAVMHHELCPCGNPSPWLELEGRTDDMLKLTQQGQPVRVPPLAVYAVLKEVHSLRRFQLVVHPGNVLELRVEPATGITPEQAFEQGAAALRTFLADYGVTTVRIEPSAVPPTQHASSGKFKHILSLT
ncbi:MAG: phenylacetate--CoA ligase family protein [Eubacteriales bacterium]|nr:phenylacetate--CoA ligase family protein [Eubacteriales bacterium]